MMNEIIMGAPSTGYLTLMVGVDAGRAPGKLASGRTDRRR